jgi:ABC-type lipoprotein release transport system permease subunit
VDIHRDAASVRPFVVPWHAIFAVPILGIGIGVLAALIPGSRASSIEPADAVRFE